MGFVSVKKIFAIKLPVFLIRLYQVVFSPLFGGECRFTPSCSEFAIEAVQKLDFPDSLQAVARRVLSCHPFLLGWYYFFAPKQPPISQPTMPARLDSASDRSSRDGSARLVASPIGSTAPTTEVPAGAVSSTVENDFIRWELNSFGARIQKALLKGYKQTVDRESPLIDMMNAGREGGALLTCRGCNFVLPDEGGYHLANRTDGTLVYEAKGDRFLLKKIYQFSPDQYAAEVTVSLKNLSQESLAGDLGLSWNGLQKTEAKKSFFSFLKGAPDKKSFVYQLSGKLKHEGQKEGVIEERGNLSWVGIEERYFLSAMINRRLSSETAIRLASDSESLSATLSPGTISVPPGGSHQDQFTLYVSLPFRF
ncbi:MAG: membrane protein insertase YidC [Deltaproteobacteria bacterium]|nr:membrane protein insertase YidC [Deltaproteobacteria bacterium]